VQLRLSAAMPGGCGKIIVRVLKQQSTAPDAEGSITQTESMMDLITQFAHNSGEFSHAYAAILLAYIYFVFRAPGRC
jgi:hypothetical protein